MTLRFTVSEHSATSFRKKGVGLESVEVESLSLTRPRLPPAYAVMREAAGRQAVLAADGGGAAARRVELLSLLE